MLGIFRSNMQTGILVLAVILLVIVCLALFFTHKEVRDMRMAVIKNRHDIQAVQGILGEAGMAILGPPGPHDPRGPHEHFRPEEQGESMGRGPGDDVVVASLPDPDLAGGNPIHNGMPPHLFPGMTSGFPSEEPALDEPQMEPMPANADLGNEAPAKTVGPLDAAEVVDVVPVEDVVEVTSGTSGATGAADPQEPVLATTEDVKAEDADTETSSDEESSDEESSDEESD
jgi:hypothetical protein